MPDRPRRSPRFFLASEGASADTAWHPKADIYHTHDGWLVKLELAGVRAEDISIRARGSCLVISGTRRDRMVEEGYLTRTGTLLSHTDAGAREAHIISEAWGDWLKDHVERDLGRPSSGDLHAAVDAIAKRLLVEDLSSGMRERKEVTAA